MINIVINNTSVSFPLLWSELSLNQAISLRDYIQGVVWPSQQDSDELFSFFFAQGYLTEIVCMLTNKVVVDEPTLRLLWDSSLFGFIDGLKNSVDYQIENINQFECNKCWYHIPDYKDITAWQLSLINNLYISNPLANTAKICCILLCDNDEDYVSEYRFEGLKMNIVFEIFDYVCRLNASLKALYPLVYEKIITTVEGEKKTCDWRELMIFAADARPSEITSLYLLPSRDFIRLLDYKFKHLLP